MTRVSLVGTVHTPRGRANAAELLAILTRLRPEVILLELSLIHLEHYPDGFNVESTAVKRYVEGHKVPIITVSPPPRRGVLQFEEQGQAMFERIANASGDYRRLCDQNDQDVAAYGFPYLNSERCSKLLTEMQRVERATVAQLGDRQLIEFYESWKTTHKLRERAMLRNIGDYARERPFENGVFLVGAAHRQSLVDMLREEETDARSFEWDTSGFIEGPPIDGGP